MFPLLFLSSVIFGLIIILLLIARKLTFEYDQMRVTSRIPKNYMRSENLLFGTFPPKSRQILLGSF